MADATYRHGTPLMLDYTAPHPGVAAGAVLSNDDTPYVAHNDIATGELGAVASRGGVYLMLADGAIDAGAKVYWDSISKLVSVTPAATAKQHFGYVAPQNSAAEAFDQILVVHDPDGTSIST